MIESLEARALLAGDVTAVFSRGALTLRGDNSGNQVTVEADGAGGVRVTGQDGTTLNGQAGPLTFAEVTRDLRVTLKGGDDRLTVSAVQIGRNLTLDAGSGADAVTVDGARVGRNLAVRGKAGAKTVEVRWAEVAGRATVRTGHDADAVSLAGATFARKASLSTGRGDDAVTLASEFAGGRRINDGPGDDTLVEGVYRGFDFRDGEMGWTAGFADYLADQHEPFQASGLKPLPAELGVAGTGFMLGGFNLSDDLFMFLKRSLAAADGVVAGQAYEVRYRITFASNAPTGADGAGGSPGESVFLKAGATPTRPDTFLDHLGHVRLNVDKGTQSNSGPAASVIGGIGNGTSIESNPSAPVPYVSLTRTHVHRTVVTAGPGGELWLLVGTDSGFESATILYYQDIRAALIPVEAPAT